MAGPGDFFNSLDNNEATPAPAPTTGGRIDVYQGEPPPSKSGPAAFFGSLDEPTNKAPDGKEYGSLESAALHGVHGLTSGFSDEMAGLKAASGIAEGSPEWMPILPEQAIRGLARMGYQKLISGDKDASEAYTKARDEHRKALEESAAQHPALATGSDIAGSMAIPGGSAFRGATMGARALRGAGMGAIQGALRGAGEAPEASDVPKSAGEGAGFGAVLGAPVNAAFGPRIATAARQAIIDAANRYGVQLPHYMVTDSPMLQAAGENLSHLPGVGARLHEAGQRATEGIQNIRDRFVGPGTPTELRTAASQAATQAKNDFTTASKRISEQNYNAVTNALPNPHAQQIPMALWQETANQLNRLRQYGGNPGPILTQAMEAVNHAGGLSYPALKDLRTNLYTKWRSMQGKADTQYGDYVGTISAITKDMEDAVMAQGGQRAVDLWRRANAQHSIGKDIGDQITTAIGKGTGDTSAADTIFRNINSPRPNVGAIAALRNTMRPADWERIQGSVLGRMGANDAGDFSIQRLLSADAKMSNAGRDAMFGVAGNPRRDAYNAIVDLGRAVTNVNQFRNTSRTGPYLMGAGAALGLYNDFKEGNYLNTAGELGTGAILASILARPATARSATAFSRAMERYIHDPALWTAGKVPRAVETAARNFAISLSNSTGLDKDKMVNAFTSATPLWSKQ